MKTCDFCKTEGQAYTFRNNVTICPVCLKSMPADLAGCWKEIFRLRAELAALTKKSYFLITWIGGKENVIEGKTIEEAFTQAGYGGGAVAAIDFYSKITAEEAEAKRIELTARQGG